MHDEEALYNLLKETFLLLDDSDRRFFSQYDLTVSRYYALHHIGASPGISLSGLSDRMVCDKSNVTRIIKGLEGSGYIVRRPHETDARASRLYLSEEGMVVLTQVAAAHKSFNATRLQCLGELEQEGLIKGLTLLHEHMQRDLSSI